MSFAVTSRLVALATCAGIAAPALAQVVGDSDNDGVPDSADAFPCDASAAGQAFAPSEDSSGVMLVEDLWPTAGDLDFNDVVVAYHYAFALDTAGRAVRLRLTIDPLAAGGILDNGLALRLPIARTAVTSVVRRIEGGDAAALTPSVTDEQLVVVIEANLRDRLGGTEGSINSERDGVVQAGERIEVDFTFAAGTTLPIGAAPYDLFVFRTGNPGLEIHFPHYAGTSIVDPTLFNTADDGSTATRRYVDTRGLPFVIALPSSAPYPAEATDIASLFPRILGFASSGGTSDTDFYVGPTVNANAAYRDAEGNTPPRPALVPAVIATACSQDPNWVGLGSGVSAAGGNLTLSGFTSEAASSNVFEDNGIVEARLPATLSNLAIAVGLDRSSADATYQDIEHKIYLNGGGANGYFMGPWGEQRFGTVQGGDVLRVSVVNGVVQYAVLRNGATVYSRSGSSVPRQLFFGNVWAQQISSPIVIVASLATLGPRGNNPPSSAITAPAANSVFTSQDVVTISANAADADAGGAVSRVDFFTGTTLIGSDTSAPYSVSFANPAATSHVLTARAYDQWGSVRTSASRTISVVSEANWTALTGGVSASGGNLTLTAYTSEARAPATFVNNGLAEVTLPASIAGLALAIGFDTASSNNTYQDILHKIYFNGGGNNGYFMGPWGEQRFGTVQGGDVLRATVVNGTVQYGVYRNGSLIYSRTGGSASGQTMFANVWVQGISGSVLMTVRSQ